MATRFLKRWSGLARSADPSRLFLPPNHGGLNLCSITDLLKKLQVGKASLFLTSPDSGANRVAKIVLEEEEKAEQMAFKPFSFAQATYAEIPGAPQRKVVACAKLAEARKQTTQCLLHSISLRVQGQLLRIVGEEAASNLVRVHSSPPIFTA